jgi:hypothetical protein
LISKNVSLGLLSANAIIYQVSLIEQQGIRQRWLGRRNAEPSCTTPARLACQQSDKRQSPFSAMVSATKAAVDGEPSSNNQRAWQAASSPTAN